MGEASGGGWLYLQAMLVAFVLLAAILAPPSRGAFIIVPLFAGDRTEVLNRILARDARLTGLTRLGGLPVVMGSRDPLAMLALKHGALLLRAPEITCGNQMPSKGTD